ncbi:MAG: YiiX family permuted papain-like enzyme [Vicinamibacteria bacterium]|nr:YiiX family permuted papain-like enzyme [Vicinamibacteria bacterium]
MNSAPGLQDGDIIFQTSRSSQSLAIQQATRSPYSHMGIVFHQGGRAYVFEAVATVRFTPLAQWIARGQDGHYVIKRLKNAPSLLTPKALSELRKEARRMAGRAYDLTFEWSDDRLYCSELVWKLYERSLKIRIGELQKLQDFDLKAPAVRLKLRERYGERPPLDEPVIAPAAMYASPELETIAERWRTRLEAHPTNAVMTPA